MLLLIPVELQNPSQRFYKTCSITDFSDLKLLWTVRLWWARSSEWLMAIWRWSNSAFSLEYLFLADSVFGVLTKCWWLKKAEWTSSGREILMLVLGDGFKRGLFVVIFGDGKGKAHEEYPVKMMPRAHMSSSVYRWFCWFFQSQSRWFVEAVVDHNYCWL